MIHPSYSELTEATIQTTRARMTRHGAQQPLFLRYLQQANVQDRSSAELKAACKSEKGMKPLSIAVERLRSFRDKERLQSFRNRAVEAEEETKEEPVIE